MIKIIRLLGNRKAGFIITMGAVANLAAGSLVMNFNPEIYPAFFNFSMEFFFTPVKPVHTWFYILIVILFLLGGSLFFSTLETVISLITGEKGSEYDSSSRYYTRNRKLAAVLVHAAIIIALGAHLIDGFYGRTMRVQAVLGGNGFDEWVEIPGLGRMRVNTFEEITWPDGSRMDLVVRSSFMLSNGSREERIISYNSPALFNSAMREVIIQDGRNHVVAIILLDQKYNVYKLPLNRPVKINGGTLNFQGIFETDKRIAVAYFILQKGDGSGEMEERYILTGAGPVQHKTLNYSGISYSIQKMEEAFIFSGMAVYNPSIFLIMISVGLSFFGIYFMFRLNNRPISPEKGPY